MELPDHPAHRAQRAEGVEKIVVVGMDGDPGYEAQHRSAAGVDPERARHLVEADVVQVREQGVDGRSVWSGRLPDGVPDPDDAVIDVASA
ncbi:hypothetical protein GCM10009613_51080 [Pseudonocardia kongjuensis]|uniref:Uncharacterized protein n=1 Tax=Pseudonocardia kongjuensis TaxID=102227 RepID=A0ABN1Y4S0_9PSEU